MWCTSSMNYWQKVTARGKQGNDALGLQLSRAVAPPNAAQSLFHSELNDLEHVLLWSDILRGLRLYRLSALRANGI